MNPFSTNMLFIPLYPSFKYCGRRFIPPPISIDNTGTFNFLSASKVNIPFEPSNLMIIDLDLSDKKRKAKLEGKNKSAEVEKETKETKKEVVSENKAEVKTEKTEEKGKE